MTDLDERRDVPATAPGAGRRGRPPLTRTEAGSVIAVAVALVGFGIYGFTTHAPSTVGYLCSVLAVGAVLGWFRREPLPGWLAVLLAVDAVAHLAGGLVRVGDDVLYNAAIGRGSTELETHAFQYDHLVHGFGSMLATMTLWVLLVPAELRAGRGSGGLVLLCALAGIGVGAVNELVEFLTTLAHGGEHVGGYANTGWDLVANTVGALLGAAVVLWWRPSGPR